MFFEVEMRRVVVVDPLNLGDTLNTRRAVIRRLVADVDAEQCSEQHGYYVAITTLESVSEGKVRPASGAVVFWVGFKCLVLRLLRNEVLLAHVSDVMHNGFLATCGPAKIFVPRKQMDGYEFRAGPSLVYNKWSSSEGLLPIESGSMVRLKVVAVRWEPKGRTMMTVGSLNYKCLGPVQIDPVQIDPVQKAPVQNAPVQKAPVQNAPVQNAPVL